MRETLGISIGTNRPKRTLNGADENLMELVDRRHHDLRRGFLIDDALEKCAFPSRCLFTVLSCYSSYLFNQIVQQNADACFRI